MIASIWLHALHDGRVCLVAPKTHNLHGARATAEGYNGYK